MILSNRLGPADSKELLSFASGLKRVVIDVHYYNLFSDSFNNMNPQQNIEYIYNQRDSALATVTTTNGPLSFIGKSKTKFSAINTVLFLISLVWATINCTSSANKNVDF